MTARGLATTDHGFDHDDSTRAAVRLLDAALYEWNPATGDMYWSDLPAAMRLLGQDDPTRLLSSEAFHRLLPEAGLARRERVLAAGAQERANRPTLNMEYAVRASDGHLIWVEERGVWLGEASPRFVGAIRSIQGQKRRERVMLAAANRDDLTGLLPRDRFCEAAEALIARNAREDAPAVFVALAIDDLAAVNMRFGLEVGDQIIAAVARRLERAARAHDLVGRIAGNKFGILLSHCDPERIDAAVRHLLRAASHGVITTSGGAIQVSVCAGAVCADALDATSSVLSIQAEAALDEAKHRGPGELEVVQQVMETHTARAEAAETSQEILAALQDGRLVLHFQPIVNAQTGLPDKYECLARMVSATGEVNPSAAFIGAAEANGLVRFIDERVLELAAAALTERPALRLAINVSGGTVRHPDAADAYLSLREGYDRDVISRLAVEWTETCVIDGRDRVQIFADRVRAAGARFAIDDFGAGYTSFRYLKSLRPDEVKIDGVYVDGVGQSQGDISFVEALVHLAKALSMEVVAEWVSDEADAAALRSAGVDRLQGRAFGLAGPLPPPGEDTA